MLNLLRCDDLLRNGKYSKVSAMIAEVTPPNVLTNEAGQLIDKPAIRFEGKSKILLVSPVNARLIHFATGDPLGPESVGRTIVIEPRLVQAFRHDVVALRVIPAGPVPKGLLDAIGKPVPPIPLPKKQNRADSAARESQSHDAAQSLRKSKQRPNTEESNDTPQFATKANGSQ